MAEYRVELDTYSGPLDLLLYLVRRHEVDLHDIRIAELTEQYLDHVDHLERVDVDHLTDFLVMAAMLLEIKSAMLSAGLADPDDQGDGVAPEGPLGSELDPRYELVQQLLQYKRYKDAADELHRRFDVWQQRYAARPTRKPHAAVQGDDDHVAEDQELDLEDANVLELCEAYIRVLESVGQTPNDHKVVYDDTPISLHAEDIVDRIQRSGPMTLQDVFVGRTNRSERVGLFLATLELVRNRRVKIVQDDIDGHIQLELFSEDGEPTLSAESVPAWRNVTTGEVDYDWPIESLRERAAKRADRRAAYEAKADAQTAPGDPSTVSDDEESLSDEPDGSNLGSATPEHDDVEITTTA